MVGLLHVFPRGYYCRVSEMFRHFAKDSGREHAARLFRLRLRPRGKRKRFLRFMRLQICHSPEKHRAPKTAKEHRLVIQQSQAMDA